MLSLSFFLNLFTPFAVWRKILNLFEYDSFADASSYTLNRTREALLFSFYLTVCFSIFKYRRLKRTPRMASIRSNSAFARKCWRVGITRTRRGFKKAWTRSISTRRGTLRNIFLSLARERRAGASRFLTRL